MRYSPSNGTGLAVTSWGWKNRCCLMRAHPTTPAPSAQAHAPPRRESAPTQLLQHNSGSSADRSRWAVELRQLCQGRWASRKGASLPPEQQLPPAAPGHAAAAETAAAAEQQQQQQAAASDVQPSSSSQVTCDAAELDIQWGWEPVGASGQTREVSSRLQTSGDHGTDDAAAAPAAALPSTLTPAPWAHAAAHAAAAKAAQAAQPGAAAAALKGLALPAAPSPAAVLSSTWQGTLQFEDGEEAFAVTGAWFWPDGQPAKSGFVPPGHR